MDDGNGVLAAGTTGPEAVTWRELAEFEITRRQQWVKEHVCTKLDRLLWLDAPNSRGAGVMGGNARRRSVFEPS